jgi:multiple sugar transport system substrate-binding protein
MIRKRVLGLSVAVAAMIGLTGCSASTGGSHSLKVVYLDSGQAAMTTYMKGVAKDFEAQHKGVNVDLVPIKAVEADFYTKLALMNRSASTAPDVLWEDTFQIKSDAAAGYLAPLDNDVKKWSDWSQFVGNAKSAGVGSDGKLYGIPIGTDTQALWYNKAILAKAGVALPWKPTSWADVLSVAKKIKTTSPGVTPINIYASKAGAEASSMRGVQTLLSGTGGTLYDAANGKWVTSSAGFTQTLDMISSVYKNGLGLPESVTSNANYGNIPPTLLQSGKLAIDLDGSWLSGNWLPSGTTPWPQWNTTLGETAMPTETGAAPGTTSMSGGWTWAVGSKSKSQSLAWDFVKTATDRANSLKYDVTLSNIPVRKDVATDPAYTKSNPTAAFFSSLVSVTHFRPATSDYPQISNSIAEVSDSVESGQATAAQAAKTYGQDVVGIVGQSKTTTK